MIQRFKHAFGIDGPDNDVESVPIDDLSGEETQHAIDYLHLLDRETTTENLEWAAYQLQADEVGLANAMETLEERGELDKRLVAPRLIRGQPSGAGR